MPDFGWDWLPSFEGGQPDLVLGIRLMSDTGHCHNRLSSQHDPRPRSMADHPLLTRYRLTLAGVFKPPGF